MWVPGWTGRDEYDPFRLKIGRLTFCLWSLSELKTAVHGFNLGQGQIGEELSHEITFAFGSEDHVLYLSVLGEDTVMRH